MKNHCLYFVLGIASCLTIHWFPQQAQEPVDASARKIAELENRVQRLETIVYATSSLGTEEAQRRLTNAKKTFEHSRKLQKKGFITEAQLQSDGFAVKQAESELKLAQGQSDEAKMGAELQLLNSEQALLRAQQLLEYTRKLAAKGFATSFDVQQHERRVRRIELQLATAKRQAESLNPPPEKLEPQKSN